MFISCSHSSEPRDVGWSYHLPTTTTTLNPNCRRASACCVLVLLSTMIASSQSINPALFNGLKWRLIGPFRGGRVSAGAIDPDPNTYYIGTPGGGVWKTTDAGQVWVPIFDQVR